VDYGLTHLITHKIPTRGSPITKSPYKTPYHLKQWLDDQIKEIEEQGIIKECKRMVFSTDNSQKKTIPGDYL
jgi:hypothetical protein